jgi:Kef-type K+ transport system membrane component KefB
MDSLFFEIGTLVAIATAGAFIARFFRQPLIPSYILVGILLGPVFIGFTSIGNIFSSTSLISALSEIGIAFLLFMVGLEIDLRKLRDVERVSVVGGVFGVLAMMAITAAVTLLMGYGMLESVYLGLVIAFSSTMVVVKILSDRKELDTLHGRIILGILLVQDLVAVIALVVLDSIDSMDWLRLFTVIAAGIALCYGAFLASKHVFSKLYRFTGDSHELFFLLSVGVCFAFCMAFVSFGYSIAVGAFVAGISLGSLPYSYEIISRVKPLRDFFAIMFFVSLGLQLPLDGLGGMFIPVIVFLLLVVVIKPVIITALTGLLKYKRRTSFMTGFSMAQVSEFSLIIMGQGLLLGHVSAGLFGVTIIVTILTIAASSYLIKYEYPIYGLLSKDLAHFERDETKEESLSYKPKEPSDILLIGFDRTGYTIFQTLRKQKRFLVVDYNPEALKRLIHEKVPCMYGDAGNAELLDKIDFANIPTLISTIPDLPESVLILKRAKDKNPRIIAFMTAYHVDDALTLYEKGADYVILPHFLGGHHASILVIEASKNLAALVDERLRHMEELRRRKSIGQEHPRT